MIVKNAIGGRFKIHSLNLSFNPGDIVDLSFHLSQEEINENRELKKALEKGHLKPIDPRTDAQMQVHNPFIAPRNGPSTSFRGHPSVRRAVFVEKHAESDEMTFANYILLSQLNRAAIVARTQDAELLCEIAEKDEDVHLVASAQNRLNDLPVTV